MICVKLSPSVLCLSCTRRFLKCVVAEIHGCVYDPATCWKRRFVTTCRARVNIDRLYLSPCPKIVTHLMHTPHVPVALCPACHTHHTPFVLLSTYLWFRSRHASYEYAQSLDR